MRRRATHLAMRASAVIALCAWATPGSPAQTFTTLLSFDGANGANPYLAGLIQASNGDLYGTTQYGGATYSTNGGAGTVFAIDPSGALTGVESFCPQSGCSGNGSNPFAGLVQAGNSQLYGTTSSGGTSGYGTVFEITPRGKMTTLYSFDGTGGESPWAGLVQAGNGDLYGTTYGTPPYAAHAQGGTASAGTIFKITPSGALTTLYSFCAKSHCADGEKPWAGLVQAGNGDLYGTTSEGGTQKSGTIFKITPSGTLTTLYSFCSQSGCTDGEFPYAGLVQASNGDLYGTTLAGGASCDTGIGCGTVFKMTPGGTLTTVYRFCSLANCADGASPYAGLIQASDGNLYGTTYGTAYRITPSGSLTTLYTFCSQSGCTDGEFVYAGLVQAGNGDLYGTTYGGGTNGLGTVFRLSLGLKPPVLR